MIEKEKAKAYNKAIERAKKLADIDKIKCIEQIFPELTEPDDNKIKKSLLRFHKSTIDIDGIKGDDILAWLEKQGEPQGKSALEAIKEEKVDNELAKSLCVEPKFKVGDWITFYGVNPFKVLKIESKINGVLDYLLLDQNGHDFYFNKNYVDKNARLWTIQDVKDGDVLVHSSFMFDDFIFIYNNTSILQAYCYYSNERNRFIIEDRGHHCPWNMQEVTPATKEQRDLLFQKMKEAGYEWDADKKELKKLVPNRFDPKTLKPFDKVLVRDDETCIWKADFYSHKGESRTLPFKCVSLIYKCCIPYNEDTKHLVGTKEEAPEYYRYWED